MASAAPSRGSARIACWFSSGSLPQGGQMHLRARRCASPAGQSGRGRAAMGASTSGFSGSDNGSVAAGSAA